MTVELAMKKWAAKKYKIDINTIESVDIDHRKGSQGCPTCDYGGECDFSITITLKGTPPKYRYETESEYNSFTTILSELLAIR